MGVLLSGTGKSKESGKFLTDTAGIRGDLAKETPELCAPEVVSSLNNLGIFLKRQ